MSIPCEVIEDLVSLYKDRAVQPKTASEVNAHLKSCSQCREYYRIYDSIEYRRVASTLKPPPITTTEAKYAVLSSRLRRYRKRLLAGVAAIGLILTGAVVVLAFLLNRTRRHSCD
jgi:predicted anti-sigma-YlaC factor YlaD